MKLTDEQRAQLIDEMINADLDRDSFGDGQLRDSLLRNGFKGYENMTDAELIEEADGYNLSEELEDLVADLMIDKQAFEAHAGQMGGFQS